MGGPGWKPFMEQGFESIQLAGESSSSSLVISLAPSRVPVPLLPGEVT